MDEDLIRLVDIQDLRVGQEVTLLWDFYTMKAQRVKIVAVSHDNTDDGLIPFSQITVRRRGHRPDQDIKLSGPMIRYHLRKD